jgi:hypothetical protein
MIMSFEHGTSMVNVLSGLLLATGCNPRDKPTHRESREMADQYGYKAFYKGKEWEVYTDKGTYGAQKLAAAHFGVKPNKSFQVHVVLCERPDGSTVEHVATE